MHEGGTTIGSATSRSQHSELTAFLDFRNRILFVRRYFPGWLPWTIFIELLQIADYGRLRAFRSSLAALNGMIAGLLGRTGRPNGSILARNRASARRTRDLHRARPSKGLRRKGAAKRRFKIAVSMLVFVARFVARGMCRLVGIRCERSLTILYYHGIPLEQAERFEQQMHQLSHWARVVPADWDCNPAEERGEDRYLVSITFDDAFESVIDNGLPVLARYRFPCTIFVPMGHVGQPPSWAMESDVDRCERGGEAIGAPHPCGPRDLRIAMSDFVRPATYSRRISASGNSVAYIRWSNRIALWMCRIAVSTSGAWPHTPRGRRISIVTRIDSGNQWKKAVEQCGSTGNQ